MFPHVRAHVVGATALAFARLETPIELDAPDGRAVDVVLLLVAPYDLRGALYQPLLAALAELLHARDGRRALRSVAGFADLERHRQGFANTISRREAMNYYGL